MSFAVLNILDVLKNLGEVHVNELISTFKCSLNAEIQDFLQNKAVDFAKKKISITYLVFNQANRLVAYFTITHKLVLIPTDGLKLSKTQLKRLERFSVFKSENGKHRASAFLIAQIGKNTSIVNEDNISGKQLMDFTFAKLRDIQYLVGGGVVFLECEDREKLLNFYSDNGFKPYGKRRSSEGITYHQLLYVI